MTTYKYPVTKQTIDRLDKLTLIVLPEGMVATDIPPLKAIVSCSIATYNLQVRTKQLRSKFEEVRTYANTERDCPRDCEKARTNKDGASEDLVNAKKMLLSRQVFEVASRGRKSNRLQGEKAGQNKVMGVVLKKLEEIFNSDALPIILLTAALSGIFVMITVEVFRHIGWLK